MSTRSALAFKTEDGWEGIYCHWDGYPTNRGSQIWKILMEDFCLNKGELGVQNDGKIETALRSFVDVYIKGHPSGWSSFPDTCYCHDPGFVMRDGIIDGKITSKDNDPLFIEWVYIIDVKEKKLVILTSYSTGKTIQKVDYKGKKYDSSEYAHKVACVADIDPDKPEPDWEAIERLEYAT